jgi:hypothetical protein
MTVENFLLFGKQFNPVWKVRRCAILDTQIGDLIGRNGNQIWKQRKLVLATLRENLVIKLVKIARPLCLPNLQQ